MYIKNIFFILFFCLITSSQLWALDNFQEGKKAYNKGEYEIALTFFKAETQNDLTGELAYNIGNCFYNTKDYAHALLWYKKAQKYLFYDSDLNFNMNACLEKLSLKDSDLLFMRDRVFFLNKYMPEAVVNILSLVSFVVFICYAIARHKKDHFAAKIIFFFLAIFFISSSGYYFLQYNLDKKGIIIDNAQVHSAYSENASVLFSIKKGSYVSVRIIKDDYYKILTKDGRPGWIEKKKLGVI